MPLIEVFSLDYPEGADARGDEAAVFDGLIDGLDGDLLQQADLFNAQPRCACHETIIACFQDYACNCEKKCARIADRSRALGKRS